MAKHRLPDNKPNDAWRQSNLDVLTIGTLWRLGDTVAAQHALLMAQAADNERLREQLKALETIAYVDPLTLLSTRLRGEQIYTNLTQAYPQRRSKEPPQPYLQDHGVLMIDIDHFKDINDTRGHSFGSGVLREVAKRTREAVRESDHVIRYGGDELTVIAPDTSVGDAENIADNILDSIGKIESVHSTPIRVSVSIGIGRLLLGGSLEAGIGQADAALYAAKQAGRAQAMTFDTSMGIPL